MTRKELFGDRERQHKRLHDEKKTKMTTRVELDGEAAPQEPATNDAANGPTEALRVSVPATWEGRGAGGGVAYMGGYSVSSSSLKVSLGGDSHAAAISFSFSASVKKKKWCQRFRLGAEVHRTGHWKGECDMPRHRETKGPVRLAGRGLNRHPPKLRSIKKWLRTNKFAMNPGHFFQGSRVFEQKLLGMDKSTSSIKLLKLVHLEYIQDNGIKHSLTTNQSAGPLFLFF